MSAQNQHRELIIDTSVAVKFFVEEEGSDEADDLLRRFISGELQLVALDFMFIEFANVMWTKTRLGELTVQEAEEKTSRLLELSPLMEVVPSTSILLQALGSAGKYGVAVYDSALVALANSRNLQFVTADGTLYRKVKPAPMPHRSYPIGESNSLDSTYWQLICCSTATSFQTKWLPPHSKVNVRMLEGEFFPGLSAAVQTMTCFQGACPLV